VRKAGHFVRKSSHFIASSVDWDQPILAPKERDLMFIVGDKVGGFVIDPGQEKLFFEGYGESEVDPLVLSYWFSLMFEPDNLIEMTHEGYVK
jgi:hypothetical protein